MHCVVCHERRALSPEVLNLREPSLVHLALGRTTGKNLSSLLSAQKHEGQSYSCQLPWGPQLLRRSRQCSLPSDVELSHLARRSGAASTVAGRRKRISICRVPRRTGGTGWGPPRCLHPRSRVFGRAHVCSEVHHMDVKSSRIISGTSTDVDRPWWQKMGLLHNGEWFGGGWSRLAGGRTGRTT